jgi:hypothetical protein
MKVSPMMRALGLAGLLCACALVGPVASEAVTTQTFTTSQSEFDPGSRNQGWWSPTLTNSTFNDNYFVGDVGVGLARNFFSFDLASACPASSVTLQLTRFDQTGPLTYNLWDVSTAAATLNNNVGPSQTTFDDLGSGTSFGSFQVADGAETDVLSFPLNPAGVAAFNAARGGFFSVGGQTPGETSPPSYIYAFSGGPNGTQQLAVTCLPTTKDECTNGGWRDFGVFKNQGDCVSFVATKGKNPPGDH